MSHRPEQVSNLIKEELSEIISREIEFPDLLVTITDVAVDKKMSEAVVSFSVLSMCGACPMAGGCHGIESSLASSRYARSGEARRDLAQPEKSFEIVLKILEKNRRHLQYLLMKKINIKPMPQIRFKKDRGLEESAKIEKILLDDKMK